MDKRYLKPKRYFKLTMCKAKQRAEDEKFSDIKQYDSTFVKNVKQMKKRDSKDTPVGIWI